MIIVDAHHHLWDLKHHLYPWLQAQPDPTDWVGDLTPIRHDYLVTDYIADAQPCGVAKSVHIQAGWDPSDPVGETKWLQSVADRHGFPHAIVAAARLEAVDLDDVLDAHVGYANTRGIRQMLDRDGGSLLLGRQEWEKGLARLPEYGLSFDLQVNPEELKAAAELARRHPDLVFVLNHCGMPRVRTESALGLWRRNLRLLAGESNVVAKVSGLGMFDHGWSVTSIRPYVEEMLDTFGVERCMFGSNFPVDGLYTTYSTVVEAMEELTQSLSDAEQQAFFYDNAVRTYRL